MQYIIAKEFNKKKPYSGETTEEISELTQGIVTRLGQSIYRLETYTRLLKDTNNLEICNTLLKQAIKMQHLHQELLEKLDEIGYTE